MLMDKIAILSVRKKRPFLYRLVWVCSRANFDIGGTGECTHQAKSHHGRFFRTTRNECGFCFCFESMSGGCEHVARNLCAHAQACEARCPLEMTMYALHLRWVTEEAISGLHCARACGCARASPLHTCAPHGQHVCTCTCTRTDAHAHANEQMHMHTQT